MVSRDQAAAGRAGPLPGASRRGDARRPRLRRRRPARTGGACWWWSSLAFAVAVVTGPGQQLHLRLRPERPAHVGRRRPRAWWWWPRCSAWPACSSAGAARRPCRPPAHGGGRHGRPWRCRAILTYSGSRLALLVGYELAVLGAPPSPRPPARSPTSCSPPGAGVGGGLERGRQRGRRRGGLVVFGAVADVGNRFAFGATSTFLPVLLATALFALLPETRGREPEELWPRTPPEERGARPESSLPSIRARWSWSTPCAPPARCGSSSPTPSPTTWCTASSTRPASRPTGEPPGVAGGGGARPRPEGGRCATSICPAGTSTSPRARPASCPGRRSPTPKPSAGPSARRRRLAPRRRGPGGSPSTSTRCPCSCSCSPISASWPAVDRGFERYTLVGGASVYPFVWSILLAARAEGLGGVMTTMVVRHEDDVRALFGVPDHMAVAGPRRPGPARPPAHPAAARPGRGLHHRRRLRRPRPGGARAERRAGHRRRGPHVPTAHRVLGGQRRGGGGGHGRAGGPPPRDGSTSWPESDPEDEPPARSRACPPCCWRAPSTTSPRARGWRGRSHAPACSAIRSASSMRPAHACSAACARRSARSPRGGPWCRTTLDAASWSSRRRATRTATCWRGCSKPGILLSTVRLTGAWQAAIHRPA